MPRTSRTAFVSCSTACTFDRRLTSMTYDSILFDVAEGVARITLNRPDRLNSFTSAMHLELRDALTRVEEDATLRVLVLTGAGRGFCAGQDLADRAVAP